VFLIKNPNFNVDLVRYSGNEFHFVKELDLYGKKMLSALMVKSPPLPVLTQSEMVEDSPS